MIWLFKDDDANVFSEDAVPELLAKGWTYKRTKKKQPKLPTKLKPATDSTDDTTILYKGVKKGTIQEEIFANKDVDQALKDGWYKDVDDATSSLADELTEPDADDTTEPDDDELTEPARAFVAPDEMTESRSGHQESPGYVG